MAHDFLITKQSNENEYAVFSGYCNGLMYEAFGHPECDMGVSGSGDHFIISYNEMIFSATRAMILFGESGYPDPTRLNHFVAFVMREQQDPKRWAEKYKISFL